MEAFDEDPRQTSNFLLSFRVICSLQCRRNEKEPFVPFLRPGSELINRNPAQICHHIYQKFHIATALPLTKNYQLDDRNRCGTDKSAKRTPSDQTDTCTDELDTGLLRGLSHPSLNGHPYMVTLRRT